MADKKAARSKRFDKSKKYALALEQDLAEEHRHWLTELEKLNELREKAAELSIRWWLSWLLQEYERTSNPLYLWECYADARKCQINVPDEVFAYFDRCANWLTAVPGKVGDRFEREIATALEMKQGGRDNVFRRIERERRNFDILADFIDELDLHGEQECLRRLGVKYGLTRKQLVTILLKYSELDTLRD